MVLPLKNVVVYLQKSTVPVLQIKMEATTECFCPHLPPAEGLVTTGTAQISSSHSGTTSGNGSPPLQLRPAVMPGWQIQGSQTAEAVWFDQQAVLLNSQTRSSN